MSGYIVDAVLSNGTVLKVDERMFNPVYRPYFYTTDRVNIYFGGASSGKSTFNFMTVPLQMLLFDRNYLILMKEKTKCRIACVNEIKRALATFKLEHLFEWKQSPATTLTCKLNGRIILFEGLEDVEQLKSIVPPKGTFTDIILEEATNVKEGDYDQLLLRQRGTDKDSRGNEIAKRIHVLFNPVSKNHWIYRKFFLGKFDEKKDKALRYQQLVKLDDKLTSISISILKTTYRDNKFLSEEDIATINSQTDPNMYEVYVNGNFGSLGKTIFTPNSNYFVVPNLREKMNSGEYAGLPIRMGLDFGGGVAPFFFVKCKLDRKKKKIYVYDTFSIVDVDIDQLWMLIKKKVYGCGMMRVEQGHDMRKQLKKLGAPIKPARKGNKSIITGLNWLKGYQIYIDSSLLDIIENFELYSWKKNKMGEYVEIPEDVNNDGIDALRYALSYEIIGKTKIKKGSVQI